jgi:succinoglycan biosynthesis transport protein ExoP
VIDTAALPKIGVKPLLSWRRHRRAGLVAALLVILIGTPIAWIKGRSHWVAESVFQVAPSYMKNLETDKELELQSNSQYREFVNHLSSSVTRNDILERALADLKARGIDTRPGALTERKYIEQLKRTIYVRAIPDTYMVRIGLEDADKVHIADVINAVTDAFVATTHAEQIYGSSERLAALEKNIGEIRGEIQQLQDERVVLASRLTLTTFGESTQNPYDGMLAQAREKLTAATIERAQADAALVAFDRQHEVPSGFVGRSLLEMRLQDNGLQALRNEVVKRTEELNRVITGLEPEHPARRAATAELAAVAQRLKTAEGSFDRETAANFRSRLVANQQQRVRVEEELRAMVVRLEGQAAEFARAFQRAMQLTGEIRKRETELEKLRDRISYLDTERNALGFVRVVTRALAPETPMGLGKTRLLLLVLAAAAVFCIAVPVALDLLDRRIRSVNDAERLMGMPAAGWQVRREDLPTQFLADEQARRFASTLMRNRARSQRHVFAFTSVKPGAGVTTSILDTARALKQLGERVLVVEANTFNPHPDFGASGPGLADHLGGSAGLGDLTRSLHWGDVQLDVVGLGRGARTALTRLDRFRAALAQWSTSYDFVLVDLPPLLVSADAELLVDAVGQVFLAVESDAVSVGEITRANRLLQKLDPDAVGLFVSKVTVFRGAGYMEPLIIETLTGRRFKDFMSLAPWKLWWSTLLARRSLPRPRPAQ